MLGKQMIYFSGRTREGKYVQRYVNRYIPETPDYFRIHQQQGFVYSLDEVTALIARLAPAHPEGVFVLRPI